MLLHVYIYWCTMFLGSKNAMTLINILQDRLPGVVKGLSPGWKPKPVVEKGGAGFIQGMFANVQTRATEKTSNASTATCSSQALLKAPITTSLKRSATDAISKPSTTRRTSVKRFDCYIFGREKIKSHLQYTTSIVTTVALSAVKSLVRLILAFVSYAVRIMQSNYNNYITLSKHCRTMYIIIFIQQRNF